MGRVVKLRPTSSGIRCSEDAMNIIRIEMHGIHPDDLAGMVGVRASTIRAIRSGRTKWPRAATFFGLLGALGYRMELVKV